MIEFLSCIHIHSEGEDLNEISKTKSIRMVPTLCGMASTDKWDNDKITFDFSYSKKSHEGMGRKMLHVYLPNVFWPFLTWWVGCVLKSILGVRARRLCTSWWRKWAPSLQTGNLTSTSNSYRCHSTKKKILKSWNWMFRACGLSHQSPFCIVCTRLGWRRLFTFHHQVKSRYTSYRWILINVYIYQWWN